MQIDPRLVKWDEAPQEAPAQIDPRLVKWEEPKQSDFLSSVSNAARLLTPAGQASMLLSKEGRGDLANFAAGGLRGAGSIGATLMYPVDKLTDMVKGDRGPSITGLVTGKQPVSRNEERRQAMTGALEDMGADPNSGMFQAGKIGAEVGGTWPVGGLVGRAVGQVAPRLGQAISSAGMSTGAAPATFAGKAADLGIRALGGGVNAGATAGLIDPAMAPAAAGVGAFLPPALKAAGSAGAAVSDAMRGGARRLMQSAIKPTIAQLKSGDADVAVNTVLERGINPNRAGVDKLTGLIDDADSQLTAQIANSTAQIDKQSVLNRLGDVRAQFGSQVSPTNDLKAIQGVADDFLAHPTFPGASIPVQGAQDLKRGTYGVLSKKYGEMKGAETEAQKALARGLKEEIATAVPGVQPLNAELSKLLTAREVAERRALMEMNKNPGGLSLLAPSPQAFALFMADKSALLKALAARGMNTAAGPTGKAVGLLNSPVLPYARYGLLANEASP